MPRDWLAEPWSRDVTATAAMTRKLEAQHLEALQWIQNKTRELEALSQDERVAAEALRSWLTSLRKGLVVFAIILTLVQLLMRDMLPVSFIQVREAYMQARLPTWFGLPWPKWLSVQPISQHDLDGTL